MQLSYGFIETQGLIGSIEAADAMLKAANVRLVQEREIGFGLVTVIVEGELGAVQSAVEAGREAAERVGQFITAHVIPRPFNDTEFIVLQKRSTEIPKKSETVKIQTENQSVPIKVKDKKVAKRTTAKKTGKSKSVQQKSTPVKVVAIQKDASSREIQKLLKKKKDGLTLEEIAGSIKKDSAETRILLKQMIDQGLIEKVQQRYYIL